MSRVGIVVACRLGSSRLPGKGLADIGGETVISRCLTQCSAASSAVEVVLATSTRVEDAQLAEQRPSEAIGFHEGSLEDIFGRNLAVARRFGFDTIVRATGDNPLVSPEAIDTLVTDHFEQEAQYSVFDGGTLGLTSVEVMEIRAMEEIADRLGDTSGCEHLGWFFLENADRFRINRPSPPAKLVRDYRLTVDYPEDLETIRRVVSELGPSQGAYSADAVIGLLDAKPEIAAMNGHLRQGDSDPEYVEKMKRAVRL